MYISTSPESRIFGKKDAKASNVLSISSLQNDPRRKPFLIKSRIFISSSLQLYLVRASSELILPSDTPLRPIRMAIDIAKNMEPWQMIPKK